MRLIVFRQVQRGGGDNTPDLLEYALSAAPLSGTVLDSLGRAFIAREGTPRLRGLMGEVANDGLAWAIPRTWSTALPAGIGRQILYTDAVEVGPDALAGARGRAWFVISNGRFVARPNCQLLEQAVADAAADVVAVMVEPQLAAYRERIRLTQQGRLVGCRRLYQDSLEPILLPRQWPHHLFIRGEVAASILNGGLPEEFRGFIERGRSCRWRLKALAVAGSVMDLGTEEGLLSLTRTALRGALSCDRATGTVMRQGAGVLEHRRDGISPTSRFVGPVVVGDRVTVEADAVVIGPGILCDDSRVGRGAVVHSSVVGMGSEVAADQVVRDALVGIRQGPTDDGSTPCKAVFRARGAATDSGAAFRNWSRFSYAGCFKRIVDGIAAITVLVLFAPIIPFIACAVKASSPGPVFFRHKRQGFHGRPFYCIKFRTMKVGADKLQDTLRSISEVDGPQFKLADDPRITTVGRFLRETYLDEIPQFYNVLRGDMSVVGPRPSPESENTLCPWWRDARLSVRPGVTGLWQISRTRKPMKDFQEWIHYDTKYVRELSLRLDLWICWRTLRKMAVNFARQF